MSSGVSTVIRTRARILRYAFLSALADLRAMYTWKTWLFGWLCRVLCQVAFFSLIGKLVGSVEVTVFLVIGNSVFVAAQAVLLTVSSTAWERMTGTLPLLVAAPAPPFVVFAGRSVQWIADGIACGTISLFLMAPLFGVDLPMPAALLAIPLLALVALSVYAFALVLGGLVLRMIELRALVANVSIFVLMLLTGVQVPESFWPRPVAVLADLLPMTHGLRAIRGLLGDAGAAAIAVDTAAEVAVGLGWFLVAALVFRRLASSGRRDGSIEFGD
jgi:ABC-2 type transport system permease protein